ncbi:hypothetical protein ACJQWK_00776 [Exserohilum turcicum]|uniref:N-acetyltransferase domain-containing protein n=1 Tax=Exserohilum turcicum (strain 28A) TaxID=671987 RepID=R0IG09_EXST2|nr:uncharacterized protein SETTUDRAFT_138968 [Exserohilum turcica Et28A]EOA84135.1 hypothetical protein SETTUDRAFT_138968 [Exserohilum turcica Et28A]
MKETFFTPHLKLTLITTAERGSQELEWLHEVRSDEKATWWSIFGQSKTIEDTEKAMKGVLPTTVNEGDAKPYRIVYAVHELLAPDRNPASQESTPTRFIGLITLRSLGPNDLHIAASFFPESIYEAGCLSMELGDQFMPAAWGKGFATESITAILDACQNEQTFRDNHDKVFVRAVVNAENPASRRVMVKCGMQELGVHVWTGEEIWLGGKWRTTDSLHIYGKFVMG